MSIPLVQEATKDAINTSIIAIKRNIERINMLLGLVDSGSPDLSGLATKQELEDAVNSLQPVDEVTSGNMQSVTSNAVADALKLVPDYAQGNLVTNGSTSYTPSEDVYLMYCMTSSSNDARLSIGGVNNLCCYASYGGVWTIIFNGIVKKGAVIKRVDNGNFDTRSIKAFKLKLL